MCVQGVYILYHKVRCLSVWGGGKVGLTRFLKWCANNCPCLSVRSVLTILGEYRSNHVSLIN